MHFFMFALLGMFQRLDTMRKNAFGSVALFGESNNSQIAGIWVWRGQELVFPLSPDWQVCGFDEHFLVITRNPSAFEGRL